ncbi:hypothetical protein NLG97_g9423 [Lecanicillium saksenae]|uniref:Uncharacterized protein n=1 Tax=Lecanicillium saksenae TaxID=468837 RepID=A0ACC1QJ13_9HYPO|nr:hypothetical protein NLG97_g9423 [Lecanicillium saksenae]
MKLKFRLQPVPQQAAHLATSCEASELDFIHVEDPTKAKDAATQRKIRRHVMRSTRGGRAASSHRRTQSDLASLVPTPTAAEFDYFKVCTRFECLFRSMDMVSEGLLAMTVADMSYHSQLTVGDDLDHLRNLPIYSHDRPINGIAQYTDSINLVRESITGLHNEPSRNAVIGTIVCLAYLDMRVGNCGRCKMHLDGLVKVVELCGGLEAIESSPPIRQALFVADILDSAIMDSLPRFELPRDPPFIPPGFVPKPGERMINCLASLRSPTPSDQAARGVVESALKSASQLGFLLNRFGAQGQMSINLLLPVCKITHDVLSLPSLPGASRSSSRSSSVSSLNHEVDLHTTPACAMAELVRITVLSMVRIIMAKTSGDDLYCANSPSHILRQLLQQTADKDWKKCNDIRLWILATQTLLERGPLRHWLLDEIVRVTSLLSIKSYKAVVTCLQKVVWIDKLITQEMAQLKLDIEGLLSGPRGPSSTAS